MILTRFIAGKASSAYRLPQSTKNNGPFFWVWGGGGYIFTYFGGGGGVQVGMRGQSGLRHLEGS